MADIFAQLKDSLAPSYVLEREIGRGGMATVYLAREHLLVLEPSQKDVPATVILNWGNAFAARVSATK